ncbi:hypothetical protein QBC37DRAFT_470677 [Rhypophila decipiens]|uniref:Uncharacterized protein n=1 Tax=Rhypophila decipiens TaxID=261697 RepID=A0AAN6YDV4_9PEZI|nr:hypothetical protein QBC37DRAFT_470677 [Rhypophila decipiens]
MKQTTMLSASLGLALAGLVNAAEFIDVVGKGTVAVLNGTDIDKLTLADRIGCLNANGALTLDDCAVFTIYEPEEYDGLLRLMTTEAGNCTFQDETQPTNVDSIYGKGDHAWSCDGEHPQADIYDGVYTLNGLKMPFVCNGDINCFYDVKKAPKNKTDAIPVWQFRWGSQQRGITPGHLQVAWLWQPVKST